MSGRSRLTALDCSGKSRGMTVGPRHADDVLIRECVPTDDEAIRHLNDAAFGGSYESQLVGDLRAAGLAMIELVAVEHGAITGHVLFSQLAVAVGDRQIRALSLAPMSVRPDRQHRGIGSRLVR